MRHRAGVGVRATLPGDVNIHVDLYSRVETESFNNV